MLYSEYWDSLVNYDQSAVGSYPHQHQFYYVILPQFMNEVFNRHGKGFFNSTVWTAVLATNTNYVVCPRDLLTIETHGAFITEGTPATRGWEITPSHEFAPIAAVFESNALSNYPSTYRIIIAQAGELPGGTLTDGDYKILILNCKPVAGLTLKVKYVQRPPIPQHPGGVWVDTDFKYYIPDQLIPILVLFHRAYIYGDREAGNKDTRFERQLKRFYAALETLDPIMSAAPRGYSMVGSN